MSRSALLFMILAYVFSAMGDVRQNMATLTVHEDSYVNFYRPNMNFDRQWLIHEDQFMDHSYSNTKKFLLKFDLTSVSFSIAQARLILPVIQPSPNSRRHLTWFHGYTDQWQAAAVTWNTLPTVEAILPITERKQIDGNLLLEDSKGDALAAYLASQQLINGGDGIASIGFTIDEMSTLCLSAEVTQSIYGDSDNALPIQLQIVGAGDQLPPVVPTAVTSGHRPILSLNTAEWLPWLLIFLAMFTGACWWAKARSN